MWPDLPFFDFHFGMTSMQQAQNAIWKGYELRYGPWVQRVLTPSVIFVILDKSWIRLLTFEK